MNNKDLNSFKENGYLVLDIPKFSDAMLKNAFKNFVNKSFEYKKNFLQKKYNNQLDGYSYMGQEDSLNQAKEDMVETFVISDFTEYQKYPSEFHNFFAQEWKDTIHIINNASQKLLHEIDEDLKTIFKDNFSQRISCNYYPPTPKNPKTKERLSTHNDMSLFTIFPYGVSEGLQVLINDEWIDLQEENKILVFAGFFLEELTQGEYKSLIHRVKLPKNKQEERLSYAFFSNPKPQACFKYKTKTYTTEELTQKYLEQFN